MVKNNLRIYFTRGALYNIVLLFFTGGVIQTFLLESGIDTQRVSLYTSVMQVAEISAMVLLSGSLESRRDIISVDSLFHFFLIPMAAAMIITGLNKGMDPGGKYAVMLFGGIITYMAIGMVGMFDYKLPYVIMDLSDYGYVTALYGIIIGIASLSCSALISFAAKGRDYVHVISLFLIAVIILIVICALMVRRYKVLDINVDLSREQKKINLFTYKPFYLLIVPNFMRGFATGTFTLFTTIGYHYGIIDSSAATLMVTIGNIVIFLTGIAYRRAAKLHKDTQILVIAGFAMLLFMPLSFAGGKTLFLIMYAAAFFFKTVHENVSPVAITPIVDYDIVGQYSAWRVACYLAGVALSGVLTIPMTERLGIIPTMILNGLMFVYAAGSYHFVVKKMLKEKEENSLSK